MKYQLKLCKSENEEKHYVYPDYIMGRRDQKKKKQKKKQRK